MHDPIALAAELKRTQQQLRATEDDLGRERQHTADLTRRLAAEEQRTEALRIELRMLAAIRRDPDGGVCDPQPWVKPTVVAGSIDTYEDAGGVDARVREYGQRLGEVLQAWREEQA